jgi:5-formyltetrahydrofolate cyclo-ligase
MKADVEKRELRERMLGARAALTAAERSRAAEAIAGRVAALPAWGSARSVALYAAMGAEVDTSPLAARAVAEGKRLAWPRVRNGARNLEFAACEVAALVPGPLGTREPPANATPVPAGEIDLVVVPGLAFDGQGRRLGRGGGHYDATLATLRHAAAVGLAHEVQLVPAVPSEPHDARVGTVVTEARTLVSGGPPDAQTLTPGPSRGGNTPP